MHNAELLLGVGIFSLYLKSRVRVRFTILKGCCWIGLSFVYLSYILRISFVLVWDWYYLVLSADSTVVLIWSIVSLRLSSLRLVVSIGLWMVIVIVPGVMYQPPLGRTLCAPEIVTGMIGR